MRRRDSRAQGSTRRLTALRGGHGGGQSSISLRTDTGMLFESSADPLFSSFSLARSHACGRGAAAQDVEAD